MHQALRSARLIRFVGLLRAVRCPIGDDSAALDQHVWVGSGSDQAWLHGGTYLVARRIRMYVEN